jgi:hypothetical protein
MIRLLSALLSMLTLGAYASPGKTFQYVKAKEKADSDKRAIASTSTCSD